MNREQRRVAAKATRASNSRSTSIGSALDYLCQASAADESVSGCSVFLPSGETIYLDAMTARAMRDPRVKGPTQ